MVPLSWAGAAVWLCASVAVAQASEGLQDSLALLQATTLGGVSTVKEPAGGKTSFVDYKGMVCFEGLDRVAEAAMASKKASPLGSLFDRTFARPALSCNDRGFAFSGEEDPCFPGIKVFFRSAVGQEKFGVMERNTLEAYRITYKLGENSSKAQLLVDCTCHPQSTQRARAANRCANLNMVGAWMHRSLTTGKPMLCDQGPFEYATRSLAVLKSSPLAPMHQHDQIAPVSCPELGFPLMYGAIDHCYPEVRMFTKTEQPMHNCPPGGLGPDNPDCDDLGVVESGKTEKDLVVNGVWEAFMTKNGLGKVLDNDVACNCRADSMVIKFWKKQKGPDVCTPVSSKSPVRDFWAA